MKSRRLLVAFALVLTGLAANSVRAGEYTLGSLHIEQSWARATSSHARTGAAYLTIANRGATEDRLVSVTTPAAKKAELHTHLMENNVMKMRPVAALEVSPGEPSVMRPGGMHIMLMRLSAPLKEGEAFPMTLTFEKAGSVQVLVRVMRIGAMGPGRYGHDQHHNMPGHGDHHPAGHHDHRQGS